MPGQMNKVEFELFAPRAHRVCLAGTFNRWSPNELAMSRTDGGLWRLEVALPPGRHEYKYVVDGAWCCGVNEAGLLEEQVVGGVRNEHGTMNRVIEC